MVPSGQRQHTFVEVGRLYEACGYPERLRSRLTAVFMLALLVSGCGVPRKAVTPTVDHRNLAETEFLHYLAAAPVVTFGEGVRAMAILRMVDDTSADAFAKPSNAHLEALRALGAVPPGDLPPDDRVLDMGTLAYMLSRLVPIPRTVNDRLAERAGIGRRRYALKACIDAGLLPWSRPNDPVRGGVLLAALAKAEEF